MSVRAIVFTAPNQVVFRDDLQAPLLGRGDIEVRTAFSGISVGTERNFLTGGSYELGFPQLAGYQLAGQVTRTGPEATGIDVGDRIFAHLFWNNPFPGEDFAWVGAHASQHTGPTTGNIHRLPDSIGDDEASLLSVASIGLHGARRARVAEGRRVLVLGLGLIGQFAAQGASASGADVVAVDRNASRLGLAERTSGARVLDSRADDLWERLSALGPFDAVLETTSADGIFDRLIAHRVLRDGARLVMLGGRRRLDYAFNRAQETELEFVHSMHHSADDVEQVLAWHADGRFAISPLITHRLAPSDVPGFWRNALAGDRSFLGVVIDWSRT